MHVHRTAVLIAAGVGIVCTFLPWVTSPFGSENGAEDIGLVTLLLCGGAFGAALSGDRRAPMPSGARTASAICGGAAALLALWKVFDLKSDINAVGMSGVLSVGVGPYLLIGAGAAIAILPLVLQGGAAGGAASSGAPPPPPPPLGPQCERCGAPLAAATATGRLCPPCSRAAST